MRLLWIWISSIKKGEKFAVRMRSSSGKLETLAVFGEQSEANEFLWSIGDFCEEVKTNDYPVEPYFVDWFNQLTAYQKACLADKGIVDAKRMGRRYKSTAGYWLIQDKQHPNAQANGYVREHVYVMSQHLGRPMRKGETVHHRNGNRSDNRLENLEPRHSHHGPGQAIADKVAWCINFLRDYSPESLATNGATP